MNIKSIIAMEHETIMNLWNDVKKSAQRRTEYLFAWAWNFFRIITQYKW